MRTRWTIIVGLSLLLLAIGALIATPTIDGLFVYSPTPERQSPFIQNYSPQKVIESFTSEKYVGQGGFGMSSSAGFRFGTGRAFPRYVTNERTMEPFITIRSENCAPLMTALHDGIVAYLSHDDAEIVSDNGDAGSGFRLEYRIGKNVGSVAIAPLAAKRWRERHYADGRIEYPPLPPGTEDMAANIRISEKWFPDESNAIHASLQSP